MQRRDGRSGQDAARDSIRGLALGDAFGEAWFPLIRVTQRQPEQLAERFRARRVPEGPRWRWTDDTVMALGVLAVLRADGEIRQDRLARFFGRNYTADPSRGYAQGMHELLPRLAEDPPAWPALAGGLFGGEGSLGNGAAMRAAPLGAWFHADLPRAAEQARLAAEVTHRHPEGIAGGVAVAVAAALAASAEGPSGVALLSAVADHLAPGTVRNGLVYALDVPPDTSPGRAAELLGSGRQVRADDTVPFALWSAAHHLDDLTEALWTTAEGLGDVDTTCAITGGIVAAHSGLASAPRAWLARCEPLPAWATAVPSR